MRTPTTGQPMALRIEDRPIVVAVATQIFCARVQANAGKHGYSPDLELCVGEAAALLRQVDTHIKPSDKDEARRKRPRTVTLDIR
jgi:hypothetical protein